MIKQASKQASKQSRDQAKQADRGRLGTPGWQAGGPSRDQEVLHYQWFADMGNLDAQRQLARMFSQGAQADLPRSLRYFRYKDLSNTECVRLLG